jgi:transposase InsO family protein
MREPLQASGEDNETRTKRCKTSRLVETGILVNRPEPALGHRPDVCATLAGSRLRVFHQRRPPQKHRRLAVSSNVGTETVLDSIHMATWSRDNRTHGFRCHSDAGSQFTTIRCGECPAANGGVTSIERFGDSIDNAVAETVNGYDKAGLVRGPEHPGP